VGGGEAPLYPGGYEDFVHWKKLREAGGAAALPVPRATRPEARPGPIEPPVAPRAKPKAAPAVIAPRPAPAARTNGKPAAPPAPAYDPMAPRLRAAGPKPDRQARDKELRRMKTRLGDLEKRIAEKEKAVKDLEMRMASPGFYDDRPRAEQAASEHKALMWEVGDLMNQWEALQTEVETTGS
jgi:hypothetical protein